MAIIDEIIRIEDASSIIKAKTVALGLDKVDGGKIKADTWYTMVNGEIVEAQD